MDALLVDAGARVVFSIDQISVTKWQSYFVLSVLVVTIHCPIAIAEQRRLREVPKHLQIQEEEEQVFEEQFSLFHQKP